MQMVLRVAPSSIKKSSSFFEFPCAALVARDDQICSLDEADIMRVVEQRLFGDALLVFDVLGKRAGYAPDLNVYRYLLSACSHLKSIEYGSRIHTHISNSGLLPNMILENHLINMYGKCGFPDGSRRVFDSMSDRNVVSWTALCASYGQCGRNFESVNCYIEMLQSGFTPDHFSFGSVIKASSGFDDELELGKQLHAHVIKSEFGSHIIPQNALIAMYTRYGGINEACNIFYRMPTKDLISWSSIIAGFSRSGCEFEALSCFREMLSNGTTYCPNEFVFSTLFSACGTVGESGYGKQIHGLSIKYGLKGNTFAGCSLADMYAKCGSLHSAKTAFDSIKDPDVVSWNALVAGFSDAGDANEALSIFSRMRRLGVAPDDITLRSLLCGLDDPTALSQGKQLHSYIVKIGLDLNLPVRNTLLSMCSNCSDDSNAYKLFEEIRGSADLVTWNAIIGMYVQRNRPAEVFSLFKTMLMSRLRPDHVTLVGLLCVCGKMASLEMGDQAYCYARKLGVDSEIVIVNGSIDMYVKCGSLERAKNLFDSAKSLDVVSWSSMVLGYSQFGYGVKALNLFAEMQNRGIKPNHVTLVGVLTACSHVGLVDEGMQLFDAMERDHGIVPTREHFSCMVDLLSRAGRINEAEAFIDRMGVKADVVTWKTLLSACKTRGNVEVGRLAAEKIVNMDPLDSGAHVLLFNLYASSGKWREAAGVRSRMRKVGVKKNPGQSWIQIKDRVHAFCMEDGMHPERESVFAMLALISCHESRSFEEEYALC
ncbi:hypothetical protein M569_12054 [Genlisea aurea]|uniref:Pentatricopeptide repeat-containing protein n=1 Tax=Genlisea aurea TaxID=192259 RepID=S8DSE2_9LAMI|nr:hypothetical protein M569_12054 [Genlisea aurea]